MTGPHPSILLVDDDSTIRQALRTTLGQIGFNRSGTDEKVEAFEAGADDYVTKPFHIRELQARVRSAVRRFSTLAATPDESIRIGEVSLDAARRAVFRGGRPVHLTRREFDLLRCLMMNAGKPIAHERLLSAVWGPGYSGELEFREE